MSITIFDPITVGSLQLPNRIVMAPMTRNRAGEGHAPTDLNALYYAQRASAGLILTEASQVCPEGQGYPGTPGIYSEAQVAGWRKVTAAVHARGGRIALQLWHVGRISHPSLQPDGKLPVAPSAIRPAGETFTGRGMEPFVTPRALERDEIPGVVAQYAHGARMAKEAGFDAVQIHGANGYLVDQFLRDGSNQRSDEYGGAIENRARFLFEVTAAVVDVWGGDRVSVRLSPHNPFNDMRDSDPVGDFTYAAQGLNRYGLAFLEIMEGGADQNDLATPHIRKAFHGPLMVNGGYTLERANATLEAGKADLVSFGVPFLANPDLPARLAKGASLNDPVRATFYGGGAEGYTDYPALDATA
jgi:N-ethylmaleimide reductase